MSLPKHVADHLAIAEANCTGTSREAAMRELRPLGLGDFVQVLSHLPLADYPRLSACLPRMTSQDVTMAWTGGDPILVMTLAVDFARTCAERYAMLTGQTLEGRRILDFGCGYGRFIRTFSFYSDEVVGVDAWQKSLDHCREAGLGDMVVKSDDVPDTLPVSGSFDLLTAFSVFTHLSREATVRSLAALRRSARLGAVLAITIRPVEYWNFALAGALQGRDGEVREMSLAHERDGFAFLPHYGQNHYGDTSMSIAWLRDVAEGWEVSAVDRSARDGLQRYVFLKAI